MPICTSSSASRRPYSSQTWRSSRRKRSSAGRTPPSPCTGSSMMPAVWGVIASRTAFMLPKGT
jgi:hypothetical protein